MHNGATAIFADQGFEVQHALPGTHQNAACTLRWLIQSLLYRLPKRERKIAGQVKLHEIVGWDPHGPEWKELIDALDDVAQMELVCGNLLIANKPGELSEALQRDDLPILPDVPLPPPKMTYPGRRGSFLDRLRGR